MSLPAREVRPLSAVVCAQHRRARVPLGIALWLAAAASGCSDQPVTQPPADPLLEAAPVFSPNNAYSGYYTPGEIKFLDSVQSNAALDQGVASLSFIDVDGQPVSPADLIGTRPVVLVITRGNTTPICPYCSTQTARLIADYEQFVQRGVEVVVVYPVAAAADVEHLEPFLANVRSLLGDPNRKVPFPVWLDIELKAVDQLGIRKDLSKPATYIIDQAGQVRFAYVGAHLADRPSNQALLAQIDQLQIAAPAAAVSAVEASPTASPQPPLK
jgi:peroxiredoxin